MLDFVTMLSDFIWGYGLIGLCLVAGLFYSLVTRFVQVRHLSSMWRLIASNNSSSQGVSSFQALTISLSGRVGTGNIAGVAAAIGFGGPGAIFWLWVMAFLGAATSFVECTLGQIYKEEYEGQYRGGPAFYIEKAMGQKWYAWIFAIATILATGLLLPGIQTNSIGNAMETAFGGGQTFDTAIGALSLTKIISGISIVVVLGFIILGGIKRIASFTQVIVPFMALAYILIALAVVIINFQEVPAVFCTIFEDIFSPMAGLGAAIGWGVKRGVYSNEAGQGTGPHSAAAAEVDHPAKQGLVQAFSVYVDSLLICTATAFMILVTGAYNVHGEGDGVFLVQNIAADIAAKSPAYTQLAIEKVFPGAGKIFVAIALTFFSFTTLLAYYYIAETNVAYLRRSLNLPGLTAALKIGLIASAFYGTVKTASLAWGLGDVGVGMMAWLNIIGILVIFALGRPALKALRDYEEQEKLGVENFTFDPEKLGIKNADFWRKKLAEKVS